MPTENELISKVLLTIDKYKGSLPTFKKAIIDGDYTTLQQPKLFSRLLLWKVCLIVDSFTISTWATKLKETRMVYQQLTLREDMVIPWVELDQDNAYYLPPHVTRKTGLKRNFSLKGSRSIKRSALFERATDDPLSSTTQPATKGTEISDHTADLELLNIIILDVERLFPGEVFYHGDSNAIPIKRQLIEVLYVWCKCHPRVGYKQGFHEILGLIHMNLYKESITLDQDQLNSARYSPDEMVILSLYNMRFLGHDLFNIFNKFVFTSGIATTLYESEIELTKSIDLFNAYLMKVDQFIHYTLTTKLELDSQLWIIRYLRLLLIRELGNDLETTSLLWDKLIATQTQGNQTTGTTYFLEVLIFLVIQLLIQQKTELVTSDFSECLSLLLHYPIPQFTLPSNRDLYIHVLYRDAMKLYERRNDDLKLFEYGNKLNKKYNPGLKISLGYRNSSEFSDSNSARSSVDSSISTNGYNLNSVDAPTNDRADKMRFEKMRLEMRLKKKARQMIHE
ncbi:hypothetical protein CORT_0D06280 [Candida orthopsilosis Co 90-125]|uniref:Oxidant-induced cell-cycle arrest protein 5 n=1 Tax=Candida orthopsilosis (strain 90-125) TaxID=1136231 RepID=H8X5K7_CANO9|nr:hypothetical protein CORT_0D06280 [Candida orthopsilosis Co 90-125]CCG23464.1 hypothetical protein CORT_0D06280 [Candida orthopsilosis Co 90-125]